MIELICLLRIRKTQKMDNNDKLQKRELIVITLFFALPLLVMGFIYIKNTYKDKTTHTVQKENKNIYFETEPLRAQSAMVTELKTGKILYKLNEKEPRPIASITKLMTSLVASENFEKRGIEEITINKNYLTPFGDSGLLVGQVWKIKDLIDFTLITSSNDGAKALAMSAFLNDESSFVSEMNILSRKLGLVNTQFINETGLDINSETEAGAISSAEDITKILKYITTNELETFSGSANSKETITIGEKVYETENTNKLVEKLPNVLVSKTGYTDLAGGNIALVVDFGLNNPISIVVLGSSKEERESDVLKLYESTAKYYSQNLRK
jgi:serine-type D-Ala-D-Ala carboxypeptidase (penicillin-binding protein 5/6)